MRRIARLHHRAATIHAFTATVGLLLTLWAPTALPPHLAPLAPGPTPPQELSQDSVATVAFAVAPVLAPAAVTPPPGQWLHPANNAEAPVRGYAPPKTKYGAGHRGVDFASPHGQIQAPADGVVSFVGVVVNRKVLTIDHGGGYKSSFEPIDTDLTKGETVHAGGFIGTVSEYTDSGAHCTGSCFHWGVRLHGDYVNPLPLLGLFRPSVLLPVTGKG